MQYNTPKLLNFLIPLAGVILISCKVNSSELITSTNQDLVVSVELKSSEKRRINGADKLFVFGKLKAEDSNKNISAVNLDCFRLKIGDFLSENISVDSVASVLKNPYKAKNGKVMVSVYWVFEDLEESTMAGLNKELFFSNPQECVYY
jgi:hypothetical protein